MELPDFLKRENVKPVDPVAEEYMNLREKYEEIHDGHCMGNETALINDEEWIILLKFCLKHNLTIEEVEDELLGIKLNPEEAYADEDEIADTGNFFIRAFTKFRGVE